MKKAIMFIWHLTEFEYDKRDFIFNVKLLYKAFLLLIISEDKEFIFEYFSYFKDKYNLVKLFLKRKDRKRFNSVLKIINLRFK